MPCWQKCKAWHRTHTLKRNHYWRCSAPTELRLFSLLRQYLPEVQRAFRTIENFCERQKIGRHPTSPSRPTWAFLRFPSTRSQQAIVMLHLHWVPGGKVLVMSAGRGSSITQPFFVCCFSSVHNWVCPTNSLHLIKCNKEHPFVENQIYTTFQIKPRASYSRVTAEINLH